MVQILQKTPNQEQRRETLELQAYAAKKKYGIAIEDVFTAERLEQKYAPQEADDVLWFANVRLWGPKRKWFASWLNSRLIAQGLEWGRG